jgi:septal ring factor EnvC (AmiA/AmiB activator)
MKEFLNNNFKYILIAAVGIFVLYWVVYLFTPKPDMSELDKFKLEQLNKDIQIIKDNQVKLDKQIEGYKNELVKIDSTIATVRNQKITIKEFYKELGEKINGMTPSQIDSLFRKRYNY